MHPWLTRVSGLLLAASVGLTALLVACEPASPVAPARVPAAPPRGASAEQCYDSSPALGKTIDRSYTYTTHGLDGKPRAVAEYIEKSVVGGLAEFEGNQATETVTTGTSSSAGTQSAYSGKAYSRHSGRAEFTYFGDITETTVSFKKGAKGSSVTKIVYTPPLIDRSPGLLVGESFTATVRFDYSQKVNGVARAPISSSQKHTTTFMGVESLTVPAGTFKACRFDQIQEAGGPTSRQWLLVGHGTELN